MKSPQIYDNGLLTTLGLTVKDSRKLYLSYLRTDALVRVVDNCDAFFNRPRRLRPDKQELLMWDIRDDALLELRGRQLDLFKAPEEPSGSDA
jgi:hypothetical protein